jgi:hypothetical protein
MLEIRLVTVEVEASRILAGAGPDDSPIAPGPNAQLTRHIMHADALASARTILEDLPEGILERIEKGVNRWLIVDALDTAATAASEEAMRYKQKIGLTD